MTDTDLIKALESFKDNRYTVEELITFINGVPKLNRFYDDRTNDFIKYLETTPNLIKRFVDDLNLNIEVYSKEEICIIDDILKKRLHFFYVLYCMENGQDIVNTKDDIFRNLAINFFLDDDGKIELIDYLINFGVISNSVETLEKNILKDDENITKDNEINIPDGVVENNTELNDEEIKILKLRKHLIDNSLAEIGQRLQIKTCKNSMKQKSLILRTKLGAKTIDEAIRLFEDKYYKL